MKAVIHLDIGASHLRATLKPAAPGWGLRLVRNLGRTLPEKSEPTEEAAATPIVETASWVSGATRADSITALLEAAAQALHALRARQTESLDGCRLVVRTGMGTSYVGIAPMDFSSPLARSEQQLRAVARALSQEALGMEAAGHEVRWRIEANQTHLCVITLESALVAGLHTLAQAQRMTLASCQPAIVEQLDSELQKCRHQRDARTLVWTEREASGHRHAAVTFIRLVNGSAVNAWRTVTPLPTPTGDPWLQPALDRFLIASGAGVDEQAVPCVWPAHAVEASPTVAMELAA